jgi:hypothetical protein
VDCAAVQSPLKCPDGWQSRQRIFGDRVMAAKTYAEHARKRAVEAAQEHDAAECRLWSEQKASEAPRNPPQRSHNA